MTSDKQIEYKSDFFDFHVAEGVGVLKFKRGIFELGTDLSLRDALFACLREAEELPDVRVVLIFSCGDCFSGEEYRQFLTKVSGTDDGELLFAREGNTLQHFILHVIRSKNMFLAGLTGETCTPFIGTSLACDFRYAHENATFVFSHFDMNIPPGGGIGYFLPRYVGQARAVEMLYGGKTLTAREAFDLGLVNGVYSGDDFEARCIEKAQEMAKRPLAAISCTRSLLYSDTEQLEKYLEREFKIMRLGCASIISS
jgi:2-(1,2-epoxy-1,2-dihydrophenyl)acetyl-CoA isomerase